jgi:hypothetical protein
MGFDCAFCRLPFVLTFFSLAAGAVAVVVAGESPAFLLADCPFAHALATIRTNIAKMLVILVLALIGSPSRTERQHVQTALVPHKNELRRQIAAATQNFKTARPNDGCQNTFGGFIKIRN